MEEHEEDATWDVVELWDDKNGFLKSGVSYGDDGEYGNGEGI